MRCDETADGYIETQVFASPKAFEEWCAHFATYPKLEEMMAMVVADVECTEEKVYCLESDYALCPSLAQWYQNLVKVWGAPNPADFGEVRMGF